jgi:AcrR family transcriptional regulator
MLDPGIVADFRRRRIGDAMAELCVEQGYRASTIDHVARRARVGRATIYEQFKNREQIFLAILDAGIGDLLERTESAWRACAGDPDQRIEAGLAAVLAWVAEEPATAWCCLVESLCATPESLRLYLEAISRFTAMLHEAAPTEVARPRTTEESLVGGVASILSGVIRAGQAARAPDLQPQLSVFLCGPFLSLESP